MVRGVRANSAQIEPVLLDQIESIRKEGLEARSGATGKRPDEAGGRFHPTPRKRKLGAGCLFASSFGFCLDRTPGMAFAKTLDPDRKYNPAERFNISASCSIDVNIGPRFGRMD